MVKRKQYIDILKCLSLIGVVIIHVSAQNWYDASVKSIYWQTLNIFDGVVRWAVPIFVMISGVLLLQKDIKIKDLFKKYILRIAIALLFYGVLSDVMKAIIEGKSFDIFKILKDVFMGYNHFHIWYLYMLLGLYFIHPILKNIVDHLSQKKLVYVMSLIFVVSFVLPFLSFFVPEVVQIGIHQNLDNIFFPITNGYVLYFLWGYYLDQYKVNKKVFYILGIVGLLFTVIGTGVLAIHTNKADDIFYKYLTPQCFFASSAIFIFIKDKVTNITKIKFISTFVSITSKHSLIIYGIHMIYIYLLVRLGLFDITPAVFMVLINSILVFSLSFVTALLLKRIPVLNKYIS